MNANLAQSRDNPVHFRTQNYRSTSYARMPKGKNGRETTENVFSLGTKGIWCLLLSSVTSRIHTLKACPL